MNMEKSTDKPKTPEELLEADLMRAIGFTPDDLAVNREGLLSVHQKRYLIRQCNNIFYFGVPIAVFLLFMARIFLATDLPGLLFALFPILFIASMMVGWYRLIRDIRLNQVICVEGNVRVDVTGRVFILRVGDLSMKINRAAFSAFNNDHPYLIYYAPYSKTLLAAEWLWLRKRGS
jgi:hypothetical protein